MSSSARRSLLMDHLHLFYSSSEDGSPPIADGPSPGVKRALFGPVDHEENYRFVQRELARNRREASIRWNFDFSSDNPRPGRYQWEIFGQSPSTEVHTSTINSKSPVSSSEDVEERFVGVNDENLPPLHHHSLTCSTAVESEKCSSYTDSDPYKVGHPDYDRRDSATSLHNSPKFHQHISSSRQSQITDFMCHRKRSKSKVKNQDRKTTSSSEETDNGGGSVEVAALKCDAQSQSSATTPLPLQKSPSPSA